jgi:hypothetical protein
MTPRNRNICMRRWNEKQPGGQGLVSEFDVYFKNLSEADKNVRCSASYGYYLAHQPLALQIGDARGTGRCEYTVCTQHSIC